MNVQFRANSNSNLLQAEWRTGNITKKSISKELLLSREIEHSQHALWKEQLMSCWLQLSSCLPSTRRRPKCAMGSVRPQVCGFSRLSCEEAGNAKVEKETAKNSHNPQRQELSRIRELSQRWPRTAVPQLTQQRSPWKPGTSLFRRGLFVEKDKVAHVTASWQPEQFQKNGSHHSGLAQFDRHSIRSSALRSTLLKIGKATVAPIIGVEVSQLRFVTTGPPGDFHDVRSLASGTAIMLRFSWFKNDLLTGDKARFARFLCEGVPSFFFCSTERIWRRKFRQTPLKSRKTAEHGNTKCT